MPKSLIKASKQRKKTRVAVEAAAPAPDRVDNIADSIFSESLEAIRKEIRGIANGSIKSLEHDPTSRIAWLAQKAAAVASEQRKASAAEMKRIGALNYQDVITFIRQLPRDQRAGLLREASSMDLPGSVLS